MLAYHKMPRVKQKPRTKRPSSDNVIDSLKQIERLCIVSGDSDLVFNKESRRLNRVSIDTALKLCNTADSTATLTPQGKRIRDKMLELRNTTSNLPIIFSIITWNIEHHGFTSNDKDGKKSWCDTVNRSNHGYKESEEELRKRLQKVINTIGAAGYPGLIGFNEIGILAFHKISGMLYRTGKGSRYQIFTGISDISARLSSQASSFFKGASVSGLQGFSHPSQYRGTGNSPDLQDVYGNVVAIDTSIWDILEVRIEYFPTQTFRSNTAIVSRLKYNIVDGPELVWIHTHLKYTARGGSEKIGQIHSIQEIIAKERSNGIDNIVISGDLYIDRVDVRDSLTRDIGFAKTHTRKTQYYSDPDDADQILIPTDSDIKSVDIQLIPVAKKSRTDWQGGWDRHDHSDHMGVLGFLSISGTSNATEDHKHDRNREKQDVDATNYKDKIRRLYENMKFYAPN